MKVSRSRSGAVGRVLTCSRSVSGRRSFANTVASWFDTGAPGRFVPTYRDWQTSGALWLNDTTRVTALEQAVWLNLDRSRRLARGPEMITNGSFADGSTNWLVAGTGTPNWVIGTGSATVEASASGSRYLRWLPGGSVAGRVYDVSFDVLTSNGVGGVRVNNNTDNTTSVALTTGRFSAKFIAGGIGPEQLWVQAMAGWAGSITNVSIKEVPGAHRAQATSQSRYILTARKNHLVNSAWMGGGVPNGWTQPVPGGATAQSALPDGSVPYRFVAAASRPFFAAPLVTLAVGQSVTLSSTVDEAATGTETLGGTNIFAPSTGAGTNQFYVNGALTASSVLISSVPAGARIACTVTCTTAGTFIPRTGLGNSAVATGEVVLSRPMVTLGGIDQVGRYQRTGLSPQTGEYDAVGFPVGLRYDGIDDWNVTSGNVDFSFTNKVTVAIAVRKQNEANIGLILELGSTSATTPGTFGLFGPGGAGAANFSWRSMGTVSGVLSSPGSFPAPVNAVVAALADLAAPSNTIRVNGTPVTTTSDRGTGNFSSQPLYYGRRNGTGLSFDGVEHGDMVIGNLRSDADLNYLDTEFAKNFSEALP